MKDERGEPVFAGPTVDKILAETIIGHAAEHARGPTSDAETKADDGAPVSHNARSTGAPKKKSMLTIVLLALTGVITVACFLLAGNFYFVRKEKRRKR
jgi:hypothetical protein